MIVRLSENQYYQGFAYPTSLYLLSPWDMEDLRKRKIVIFGGVCWMYGTDGVSSI